MSRPRLGATASATSAKKRARTRRMPRQQIRTARLARKSNGQEAKLAFTGHLLMENRNGLVVDARLTQATGTAEPEAALAMLEALPGAGHKTVGADKNYDTAKFIAHSRAAGVTPHVAQNINAHRGSNINGRTTRHAGYKTSQVIRKRIEEANGWIKEVGGMAQTKLRGAGPGQVVICVQGCGLQFDPAAAVAQNRMNLPKIHRRPHQRLCGILKSAPNRPEDRKSKADKDKIWF